MFTKYFLLTLLACLLLIVQAHGDGPIRPTRRPPIIRPQPPPRPPPATQTCPRPTEEMLACINRWACQYIIRLDLRCLLGLNGNPLLGGPSLPEVGPVTPVLGGLLGGSGAPTPGLLDGLLG